MPTLNKFIADLTAMQQAGHGEADVFYYNTTVDAIWPINSLTTAKVDAQWAVIMCNEHDLHKNYAKLEDKDGNE